MIRIAVSSASFTTRFQSILGMARRPQAILMAAGREAGNQLRKHFVTKDRAGANTLAPDRRSHLWLKIRQSVQAPQPAGAAAVSIAINHPIIAQKVFGGPIVAKRVKNLAIPRSEEAYGRSPATLERETGLKLFVLKKKAAGGGRGGLLVSEAEGQGIKVHYLLTPRVDQDADATALPAEPAFSQSILQRAAAVLQRQPTGTQPA